MTDTIERSDGAEVLHRLVVRFAGDSGDGMQLTGDRFTSVSASFGNDLSTMPDFPAEIRAPAGTVNGVSSFQVHISDHEITTPGDEPNVLVAMNPAALKADLDRLEQGGTLIVNEDAFDERNLEKAEYTSNPLDDGSLATYRLIKVPMTSLTKQVCEPLGVKPRDAERSKNFFALGLVSFMYTRPIQPTIEWIAERFAKNELVAAANRAAFVAGYHFGETTEAVGHRYEVRPAKLPAGEYTSITGNTALAWGLVAAGQLAKLPVHARVIPHHAGQRHPPRAVEAQALRDPDDSSRGRDRGDRHGARRGVLGSPRRDDDEWPRRVAEGRDDLVGRVGRAPAASSSTSSAAARRPGCRPRPRPPTSTSRCTVATARRRSRRRLLQPGALLPRRDRSGPDRARSTARR